MLGRTPSHAAAPSWKKFLGGLTAALLLLPVPSWAAFTYTWNQPTVTGGVFNNPWTDTFSGNSLFITPAGFDVGAETVQITGTAKNTTGSTQTLGGTGGNHKTLFAGLQNIPASDGLGQFALSSFFSAETLRIQVATTNTTGGTNILNQGASNQFSSTGTQPSDAIANGLVTPVSLALAKLLPLPSRSPSVALGIGRLNPRRSQ